MSPSFGAGPIFVLICIIVQLSGIESKHSHADAVGQCTSQLGLTYSEIVRTEVVNENCAVDCITVQGHAMRVFVEDGISCHNQPGYRCFMGRCLSGEESKNVNTDNLYSLEVAIKSANVPDEDPFPMTGGSDVFVTITANRNAEPVYKDDDIICWTYVIQDNNQPKWKFTCKPGPMPLNAELKFTVADSDKPTAPKIIGAAIENVEFIMNKGSVKLPLIIDNAQSRDYFVEVDIKGKSYEKSG